MNQKSLDKKKIKYGEPCPECGLSWAHGSVKCSYHYPLEPKDYGSTGQTNQKSLDKKKTKELDWTEEYRKLLKEYQVNAEDWDCFPDLGVKFINDLLTQQRIELLEEIKDLQTYVLFNDTEKLISLEQVINLLNKKND